MDTFVITKVYSAVPSETGAEQDTSSGRIGDVQEDISPKLENGEVISSESDSNENGTTSFTQSPVITENAYRDPNISSTITQDRVSDTSIYEYLCCRCLCFLYEILENKLCPEFQW